MALEIFGGPSFSGGGASVTKAQIDALGLGPSDVASQPTLPVAAPVTASAVLAPNYLTPVSAASGPVTMTLPTPTVLGEQIGVEKSDSTANLVTVTGTIRSATGSISLQLANENIVFESESFTSWRPLSSHKTLSALDARYMVAVSPTAATAAVTASTLISNTLWRFDCTSNSISQPLPTAPSNGTILGMKRVDTVAANTLSLSAGGSDTFGAATPTAIGGAQAIWYVYSGGVWHATTSLLPLANLLTTSVASSLYSPLGIPAWQGNFQYVAGQLCVYGGNVYLAQNTFTSATSFNTSNWYLVGSLTTIPIDGTAADITPNGNQAAGAIGKVADSGHVHPASFYVAADSGVIVADSFDPSNMSTTASSTVGGTVVFAKVRVSASHTFSTVYFLIATAAVNANTAGTECGVGIYDATGGTTQYAASTAGIAAAAFGTTGLVTVALSSSVTLQPGIYTVAWWCNVTSGGSQPAFSRGASNAAVNRGATGSGARYGNAQTAVTATPATLTTMAGTQTAWWVGLA